MRTHTQHTRPAGSERPTPSPGFLWAAALAAAGLLVAALIPTPSIRPTVPEPPTQHPSTSAAAEVSLPAGRQPLLVATTTFTPVADSYVDEAVPTSNFGAKTYLYTDNSPKRTAYLRFNVGNVTDFTSATLRLYVESTNTTGIEVRSLNDNTWVENTVTAANAPAAGSVLAQTGRIAAGAWVSVNVSGYVTANGLVGFALTTTNDTAMKIASKEGTNPAELSVGPAPTTPSPYLISPTGAGTYTAVSQTTGTTFTGTLKSVGQSAVTSLMGFGGGTVRFAAGDFDYGSEYLELRDVHDLVFEGAGTAATVIHNSNSSASDTEPFNLSGADRVTIRDLTVAAGGAARTTSDAIDFDKGNSSRVERVKITASRGRGIVFDGKNAGWTANGNSVVDCTISGAASHGIEFLASSNNTVSGCTITGVGGNGIAATKSSTSAPQPNKKSSNNVIVGNTVDRAGQDGIVVTSSDGNQIRDNVVTNSATVVAGRDGIRIQSTNSVTCDDNVVTGNSATDAAAPVTQKYGLNIANVLCSRTVVGPGQTFTPNLTGAIRDVGTGTVYQ